MRKYAFVSKYWWDGRNDSTRLRNARFTWPRNQRLASYVNSRGLQADAYMYDFSPDQMLDDSIHIPYPLNVYKRSEKINIILNELNNKGYTHIALIDADMFIDIRDYSKLFDNISRHSDKHVFFHDHALLNPGPTAELTCSDKSVDLRSLDYRFAYSGDKSRGPLAGSKGAFGGFYISPIKMLLDVGGYDETFVGWGGEDQEILNRLISEKKLHYRNIVPVRNYFAWHLHHFRDHGNPLYYKRK